MLVLTQPHPTSHWQITSKNGQQITADHFARMLAEDPIIDGDELANLSKDLE
jgi:hypothetical protein